MKEFTRITNLSEVCAGWYLLMSEEEANILKGKDYIVGPAIDEFFLKTNDAYADGYFVHDILGEKVHRDEVSNILNRKVRSDTIEDYE